MNSPNDSLQKMEQAIAYSIFCIEVMIIGLLGVATASLIVQFFSLAIACPVFCLLLGGLGVYLMRSLREAGRSLPQTVVFCLLIKRS